MREWIYSECTHLVPRERRGSVVQNQPSWLCLLDINCKLDRNAGLFFQYFPRGRFKTAFCQCAFKRAMQLMLIFLLCGRWRPPWKSFLSVFFSDTWCPCRAAIRPSSSTVQHVNHWKPKRNTKNCRKDWAAAKMYRHSETIILFKRC